MTQKTQERPREAEIAEPQYKFGSPEIIREADARKIDHFSRKDLLLDTKGRVLKRVDYRNGFYVAMPLLDEKESQRIISTTYTPSGYTNNIELSNRVSELARTQSLNPGEYHARFVAPRWDLERHRRKLCLDGSLREE